MANEHSPALIDWQAWWNATSEDERIAGEKAVEVARVYHAYEKLKRSVQAVDFGDLVSLPVRLLEGSQEITQALRQAHQHVLVDEYQDVNRGSVRLLKALCGEGDNLWVVGDAKQSIYRFRRVLGQHGPIQHS